MIAMASQITSLTIVFWNVYLGADQRNQQALRHRHLCVEFTVDTGPVTQKMFPFDEVIMN